MHFIKKSECNDVKRSPKWKYSNYAQKFRLYIKCLSIFIQSVLSAHKFTVNICKEIPVCINVELPTQAQEML